MNIWDNLPDLEYTKKYKNESNINVYEVHGKQFLETISVENFKKWLIVNIDKYGERIHKSSDLGNIDNKSLSHSFRAGLQLKEIYETGDLKFPLKDAEFIKNIKYGKYHYFNDEIDKKLEKLVDNIEELSYNSKYPDKADKEYWDNFIIGSYK